MATYYALTTENAAMSGWHILAIAGTRNDALARGEQLIGTGTDIFSDTRRKNLTVLSETAALRQGYLSRFQIAQYFTEGSVR